MNAVKLNGSEVRLLKNETTGDDLHVIAARGMVFSSWRPSPEEKQMLMNDKPVWVIMRGQLVPEFILAVGDRNQVVPPEIIKRAQKNDMILNTELGKKVSKTHQRKELAVTILAYVYLFVSFAAAGYFAYVITKHLKWF